MSLKRLNLVLFVLSVGCSSTSASGKIRLHVDGDVKPYSFTNYPVGMQCGCGTCSVVISRAWSRDSSALEFILSRSRSRSRDLMAKVLGLGLKTACLVPTHVARLP